MRSFAPLTAVAFAVALSTAMATDEPCEYQAPATLTIATPAATYYVVSELCQPECLYDVWIWQESNGIEGLQDDRCWFDTSCATLYCETDTIVF